MLIPELGLVVIDILGSEESEFLSHAHSLRALCSCALVCKDWLYRSRVNIYRTLYIQDSCGLESLERTFTMQPSLRTLVESIKLSQVGRMGEGEVPFHMVAMFIRSMSFPVIQGLEIPVHARILLYYSPIWLGHASACSIQLYIASDSK